jgi:glucose/arabinose dehydrogenase
VRFALLALSLFAALSTASSRGAAGRASLTQLPGTFRSPVYATEPTGESGFLYVVEQGGLVRVLDHGRLLPKPFLNLHRLVIDRNLSGLLSIAFPRDYERTRRVYVDYVGRDRAVHVVEYRSRGLQALASTARELLRVPMTTRRSDNHYGGQLAFGPDGFLYVGVGDGREPAEAQDPASPLGKILRLDADSRHPVPHVAVYGVRNPWRFSFDSATGDLYVGDVGADTWESVDYIRHGTPWPVNLGWPDYGGRAHTNEHVPLGPGRLVHPIVVYRHEPGHCAAVVGGYVDRGSDPALSGRYLYADFCAGSIWSLLVRHGRATDVRHETNLGYLLSSFGEDSAGDLYAVAYTYTTSHVYRLGG